MPRSPRLATALAWLASPTQGEAKKAFPPFGKIDRLDPAFDKLIAPDAYLENLADGWDWAEGPIWIKDGGYLLNSDISEKQHHQMERRRRQKRFSSSERLHRRTHRPQESLVPTA